MTRDIAARHGERMPLPDVEQAALEAIAEHLAAFRCPKCGREWITGRSTVQLWHSCPVDLDLIYRERLRRQRAPRRRRYSYGYDREEETRQWAEDTFGPLRDSLADAVDDVDLLRRLEEE